MRTHTLKARVACARVDSADWTCSVCAIRSVSAARLLGPSRGDAAYSWCTPLHASRHARVRAHARPWAFAWVCVRVFGHVRLRGCVCMQRLCVHARGPARASCVRACVCVFICARVPLHAYARLCYAGGHYSGVLVGCSAGTCGVSTVLGEYSRGTRSCTLAAVEGYSRRTRAHGVYSGVPRGYPQRGRTCVLHCRLTHRKRGARHCTGALGELAPPEGYSTEYSHRLFVVRSIAARASAQAC